MRVLIACESSGIVREAFRKHGHDAWSCDLLPAEDGSPYHFQCDIREVLNDGWDLMVAHPDCTYLCSSGLHWNKRRPDRERKTREALGFVLELMNAPIPHKAIENPIGRINTAIRKPDQYVQPHEFGHDASKRTGLWLENLPPIRPTMHVEPRYVDGRPRWANQTDSGQNRLGPSADRWRERARTYEGIAGAMAEQWTFFLLNQHLNAQKEAQCTK